MQEEHAIKHPTLGGGGTSSQINYNQDLQFRQEWSTKLASFKLCLPLQVSRTGSIVQSHSPGSLCKWYSHHGGNCCYQSANGCCRQSSNNSISIAGMVGKIPSLHLLSHVMLIAVFGKWCLHELLKLKSYAFSTSFTDNYSWSIFFHFVNAKPQQLIQNLQSLSKLDCAASKSYGRPWKSTRQKKKKKFLLCHTMKFKGSLLHTSVWEKMWSDT